MVHCETEAIDGNDELLGIDAMFVGRRKSIETEDNVWRGTPRPTRRRAESSATGRHGGAETPPGRQNALCVGVVARGARFSRRGAHFRRLPDPPRQSSPGNYLVGRLVRRAADRRAYF